MDNNNGYTIGEVMNNYNSRPNNRYYVKPRKPYYNKPYHAPYSKRMKKMDYLKFVDMSTYPAKEFSHYGSFIVPQIGDKVIEDGRTYVVVDRKFDYDEESVILNIEEV